MYTEDVNMFAESPMISFDISSADSFPKKGSTAGSGVPMFKELIIKTLFSATIYTCQVQNNFTN